MLIAIPRDTTHGSLGSSRRGGHGGVLGDLTDSDAYVTDSEDSYSDSEDEWDQVPLSQPLPPFAEEAFPLSHHS